MLRSPNDPSPDALANLERSLEIHRSSSLEDACGVLSRFLIEKGYVLGFRASTGFSDDEGRRDLLIEHRETLPADTSESHIAVYEIDLPHGDLLRLELSLPTSSGVGAQTTIEGMLAHLETFCWIQSGAALLPREEGNVGGTGRIATG